MNSETVLIQEVYQDTPLQKFLELTCDWHAEYCEYHEIDYLAMINPAPEQWQSKMGHWSYLHHVRQAFADGYRRVIWLGADALVALFDEDLRRACKRDSIGAVPVTVKYAHYNCGVLYFGMGPNMLAFLDEWISHEYECTEQAWLNRYGLHMVVMLPHRYNSTYERHYDLYQPFVKGFHGVQPLERRYEIMAEYYEKLRNPEEAGEE